MDTISTVLWSSLLSFSFYTLLSYIGYEQLLLLIGGLLDLQESLAHQVLEGVRGGVLRGNVAVRYSLGRIFC